MENKCYYLFIYTAISGPVKDLSIFEPHFAYMTTLEQDGKLLLGGPMADFQGAIGLLQAESEEEAQLMIDADPAVSEGLVTAILYKWCISAGIKNLT